MADSTPSRSGRLPINGLNLYFEVHGELDRLLGGGDEEAATTGMLQKIPRARLMILPAMSHLGISGEADVLAPSDGVPRRRPAGDAGALLIWPAALSRRGSAASRRW